eukprot:CAMPEP_0176429750 /NCGR_PEP_ID=MMETSP0127-20121128/13879_1 /TAXON_ID=938130 /ORGANISM="Platyophrya macrostoma, Strain WH" /LENGTH=415 /DNA_ID=CAMNT_0017811579 /DNA_START=76 /DNA_END=1323 /DNA_ORIENTATION=+
MSDSFEETTPQKGGTVTAEAEDASPVAAEETDVSSARDPDHADQAPAIDTGSTHSVEKANGASDVAAGDAAHDERGVEETADVDGENQIPPSAVEPHSDAEEGHDDDGDDDAASVGSSQRPEVLSASASPEAHDRPASTAKQPNSELVQHHHRGADGEDEDGNSPNRQQAGSRASATGKIPHIAGSIRRAHQPLIAAVSYPPRQEGLTVADFLDPSKPLVKSTVPLTKPKAPSFIDDAALDTRKQHHTEVRMHTAIASSQILAQRNNERKYLKAQYEFEREKKIAERAIYHKERCLQWQQRLSSNPLAVDLVADNERIEEEAYVREKEERHRRAVADRRKQRIKRAIIVKALAEVPLLEKARKEKRELVDGEKREKALRDVQRVEAIQRRKLLDQELMLKERQAKLDQRILSTSR